jgi:hypothetical protein
VVGDKIVSHPTLLNQIGLHILKLKIEDGGGLSSFKNLILNVTNTAPFFKESIKNQTVKLNNTLIFSLPSKKDDESMPINISYSCIPNISDIGGYNGTHF